MTNRVRLEVPGGKAGLEWLLEEFRYFAQLHRIPLHVQQEMHVALDEVLSNIVTHGSAAGKRCDVTVALAVERGILEVEVIDDGLPFDPLSGPDPKADLPLAERSAGGLGLYLVKRLMDTLEYTRRGDRNHLVMTRAIEAMK